MAANPKLFNKLLASIDSFEGKNSFELSTQKEV